MRTTQAYVGCVIYTSRAHWSHPLKKSNELKSRKKNVATQVTEKMENVKGSKRFKNTSTNWVQQQHLEYQLLGRLRQRVTQV